MFACLFRKIFVESNTALVNFGSGGSADVSEVPGFVLDSGDVLGVGGIAKDKAESVSVFGKPDSLGSVIELACRFGEVVHIAAEARLMLARAGTCGIGKHVCGGFLLGRSSYKITAGRTAFLFRLFGNRHTGKAIKLAFRFGQFTAAGRAADYRFDLVGVIGIVDIKLAGVAFIVLFKVVCNVIFENSCLSVIGAIGVCNGDIVKSVISRFVKKRL